MQILESLKKIFSSEKDRRESQRIQTYIPASLSTQNISQMVDISDLSETGCCISSLSGYYLRNHEIVSLQVIYINELGYLYVSKDPINAVIVREMKTKNSKKVGARFIDPINAENAIEPIILDLMKPRNLRN